MVSNNSSDGGEWDIVSHTAVTILGVLTLLVNVPVVILYFKISTLRHSAGNTFLVGLAVADILCACIMIPTGVTCEIGDVFENIDQRKNVCIFYYVSNFTLSVASVYHIIAATSAKYVAIVYPMQNITACTKLRVRVVVAAIWVASFLVGHIPFYLHQDNDKVEQQEMVDNHAIFLIIFAFAIPSFVLICIHVHIYARLFLSSRPQALVTEPDNRLNNNRRIAFLFLMLFLFFVVSWLPWYLLLVRLIDAEQNRNVEIGALILRFVAPVVNPLMFTFVKRDFRKSALSLVTGLRRRRREFSSRRCNTQATSSVDRANFIERHNTDGSLKVDASEAPESVLNDASSSFVH